MRDRETTTASTQAVDEEPPGLLDLITAIEDLLPEWMSAVEGDQVAEAQHVATGRMYGERLAKLARSGRRGGPEFVVLTQFAKDDLPLAERHEQHANTYLARTVALDPLVHAAIRLVEDHPEATPLLDGLYDGVMEAMRVIDQREDRERDETMNQAARRYAHVSSLWRQLGGIYDRATKAADEANQLVAVWATGLERLRSTSAEAASE